MDERQLDEIADQLFDAFTNHDLDTVATMLASDAVLTQNGQPSGWDDFRAALEGTLRWIGNHRYEDVRRLYAQNAFIEEHTVRSTTADGTDIELTACVVVRLNDGNKITSIDEYVDTASLLAS